MSIVDLMSFDKFREWIVSGDENLEFAHRERARVPGRDARTSELYTLRNQIRVLCGDAVLPKRFVDGDAWRDSGVRVP